MKKFLCFAGLLGLLLTSCSENKQEEQKINEDSLKIEQLTSDYNEAASFNDSLLLLMSDMYMGLDSINRQEGLLYNLGGGENVDRRAEVRDNLAAIKARLAYNKKMLADLEKKIKDSGNENSVLTKTIEQLKQRIEEQDQRIAMIEQELSMARDSIVNLNQQVVETQEQLVNETQAKEEAQAAYQTADQELNTVYYAIGTKKELEENDILESKFLRSTKVMEGDFKQSYFTKADKRTLTVIQTGSTKKPKLWTKMPENTYQIVENPDKTYSLKITNPTEFWKVSPYLVIEIKK